jgi:hypothetical protein
MIKSHFLIISMIFLLLVGCSPADPATYTSTSSDIKVIEKAHSEDNQEYWIIVYDPNNQTESQKFKIIIRNEMVWNLLEENRIYASSYSKKNNETPVLEQIKHISRQDY